MPSIASTLPKLRKRYAVSIVYETDGASPRLPSRILIPQDVAFDQIADYISDQTGWLVSHFTLTHE